jgi:curved DNA-binding protein CbpA
VPTLLHCRTLISFWGVSRDASYEIIRRSYRDKAKVCHPDLGTEPGREEEFKLLNWAHRVVAEQRRRSGRSEPDASAVQGDIQTAPAASPIAELLREGWDRLERGSPHEAEGLARLALQRAREESAPYVLLSEALSAQKRFTEAIGCLLMALQLDKNCEAAREALARLQERSKTG